jgi:hypothetical protein
MIIVTGAAGFIGYHVAQRLLARGEDVVGIDSLNDYYDPALKRARLDRLKWHPSFRFRQFNIADGAAVAKTFEESRPRAVVHLAAQAGVRYSLTNPHAYVDSNRQHPRGLPTPEGRAPRVRLLQFRLWNERRSRRGAVRRVVSGVFWGGLTRRRAGNWPARPMIARRQRSE